jgi:hypothetical protein
MPAKAGIHDFLSPSQVSQHKNPNPYHPAHPTAEKSKNFKKSKIHQKPPIIFAPNRNDRRLPVDKVQNHQI